MEHGVHSNTRVFASTTQTNQVSIGIILSFAPVRITLYTGELGRSNPRENMSAAWWAGVRLLSR